MTVHLVSTIDEVLALALQPVASDVRPVKKPAAPPARPPRRRIEGAATINAEAAEHAVNRLSTSVWRTVDASSALIVVYSPRYRIDIGPHVFPTDKYQRVHARLLETGVIQPADVVEPEPASWDDLALVHTTEYLERMRDGAMSPEDVAQLELPWSREMVEGFRLMTGGTIQAALIACGLERRSRSRSHAERKHRTLRTSRLRVQRRLPHRRRPAPRLSESRRRASVRSTTSPSRCACCRRAASSGSRSSISTSTTATAPRSSSNPIRASSPSRCTSSTTIRCGSRAGRSTSGCPTARTTRPSSTSSDARCRR